MGIPRFYKWKFISNNFRLRNRYPQIRMDLGDPNKQVPIIDNLYLDFNGIVYRCLNVIISLFRIMNAF
jgi:5'-3' exonuclease